MAVISLDNGTDTVLVDDEFAEAHRDWHWWLQGGGSGSEKYYVVGRRRGTRVKECPMTAMSRAVLEFFSGKKPSYVRFLSGDTFDCRVQNLSDMARNAKRYNQTERELLEDPEFSGSLSEMRRRWRERRSGT